MTFMYWGLGIFHVYLGFICLFNGWLPTQRQTAVMAMFSLGLFFAHMALHD